MEQRKYEHDVKAKKTNEMKTQRKRGEETVEK